MSQFVRSLLPGRRFLASLLLAHVLAVVAMAASPRLHHWVHPDADDDDHDCAVMLFMHGGGDTAPGPVVATAFVGALATVFVAAGNPVGFVPSVFAGNRVLEHAPPVAG